MSFLEILNGLLIKPIQLIFEIVYMLTYDVTNNPGISIIVLSLTMNFILLPLYNRADAIQEEEWKIEKKLHNGVEHIKKTFRGDERMLILRTYYRQNNYKPTYVLRGAVSLCLEIPFFIAAYRFLSNLALLQEVSFGPIRNLGQADRMCTFMGISLNILPIIMTVINVVSSLLYTKGGTKKSKIQLYGMAFLFLILLYNSPSGLVLYWIMNNIFSLAKTVVLKFRNPSLIMKMMFSFAGIGIFVKGIFLSSTATVTAKSFLCLLGILFQLPLLYERIIQRVGKNSKKVEITGVDKNLFFISGMFLTFLSGLLIPSAVIASSPQEFVDMKLFYHPLWFLCSSFCLAFGIFVIWLGVFYFFASENVQSFFEMCLVVFAAEALINYMFFTKNVGILSSSLKYEKDFNVTVSEQLVNIGIMIIVAFVVIKCLKKWKKTVCQIVLVGCITLFCMSLLNVINIEKAVNNIKDNKFEENSISPRFQLSKTNKNVVIIMLDKAYGGYMPYLINEKPELKEMFDGFTYYSNVISFGGHTIFGVPAMMGGYEYTPVEFNKRNNESLVFKHNEALKVLPTLFSQNGFDVTVSDPPYANYQWIPDLSIFKDIPHLKCFNTSGHFSDTETTKQIIKNNKRNFFCYGIFRMLPSCLQRTLYNHGTYRQGKTIDMKVSGQNIINLYEADGIDPYFMNSYNVLTTLPEITEIENDNVGHFMFLDNNATHDPMMLQEPEYIPSVKVDNTEYENANKDRFIINGKEIIMETPSQYMYYQANMATMLQLGKWFDYLRERKCYDNTRIILVADHGYNFAHFDELLFDDIEDLSSFYPLLMVKDFNSSGFEISDEFMTNGDVPMLATQDVIANPINPFTGNLINSNDKKNQNQYIIGCHDAEISTNMGNMYQPSVWYSVHDNIWDKNNWEVVEEEDILP